MFRSVLIANRGEIAARLAKTARRLGVEAIGVCSDADKNTYPTRFMDRLVPLGGMTATESYLDQDKLLAAAREVGAEALHPGYGFLSENPDFAEKCTEAGLVFIGPPPEAMRAMGLKDQAKRMMAEAGVPVTPGYEGEDQSLERLLKEADKTGYPLLIKAVVGGGGKGMRYVSTKEDFESALTSARREAKASFGDDRILLEKFIEKARHIEVQIFADHHGNTVHLYERDCSLQRRHQKVIEETPAPGMTPSVREAMTQAAIEAARAVDYRNAGTVEFIVDASGPLRSDGFWFMEMNTRLQVEHPVTEMITGLDLVEWQLRVAAGEPLPPQETISLKGHAIEARLYAEDPEGGFLPSTGVLKQCNLGRLKDMPPLSGKRGGPLPDSRAPEIRIDSGIDEGEEITPYYDPMMAKLIVHAPEREEAVRALAETTKNLEIWPVKTNAAFLAHCLEHQDFLKAHLSTDFIPRHEQSLLTGETPQDWALFGATSLAFTQTYTVRTEDPWEKNDGWRLNAPPGILKSFSLDGQNFTLSLEPCETGFYVNLKGEKEKITCMFSGENSPEDKSLNSVSPGTRPLHLSWRGRSVVLNLLDTDEGSVLFWQGAAKILKAPIRRDLDEDAASSGEIVAPMPGRLLELRVKKGKRVKKGEPVAVMEAMKMEHVLTAPYDGDIEEICVETGTQLQDKDLILRLAEAKKQDSGS